MEIKKGLLYTKDHEWLKVEGEKAYIGITDFAQHSLGDIVFVDLPQEGDEFKKEEAFAVVESVKAASDVYMPVDSSIVEVNEEIMDDPALLNEDPYNNWLVLLEVLDKDQLEELLSPEDYEKLLSEEK